MLDQEFTVRNFKALLEKSDFFSVSGYRDIHDIEPEFTEIEESIRNNAFEFDVFRKSTIRDKAIYPPVSLKNKIVLKKINDNIRRVFRIKTQNRNSLVNNVKTLLAEESPFFVIKTDIAEFYESIDFRESIKYIKTNNLLSFKTKNLLDKLISTTNLAGSTGLPRGINLSATLAELQARPLDKLLRNIQGVYFYGRYVDDIILFCFQEPHKILGNVKEVIRKNKLSINNKKTQIMCHGFSDVPNKCNFDFLGYNFRKDEKLIVDIAYKKLNRIKTKILCALLDYKITNDSDLLIERIEYLTSNRIIGKHPSLGQLKSGIFYNYPLAQDCALSLRSLDSFLRENIFSRKKGFCASRNINIHPTDINRIKKYSFSKGYANRILNRYSMQTISKIISCWKNV